MDFDRLRKQIEFITEIDKLKGVLRQTLLIDNTRQENSAEHSWQISVMAMVLSEYFKGDIDLYHVLKLTLLHEIVEIDAGDTFCYDEKANIDKYEREKISANRIFNLLPLDQALEFNSLWNEYNSKITNEAKFASILNKLQPILNNYNTKGLMWRKHNISVDQVINRNKSTQECAPDLWGLIVEMVNESVMNGWLSSEDS